MKRGDTAVCASTDSRNHVRAGWEQPGSFLAFDGVA